MKIIKHNKIYEVEYIKNDYKSEERRGKMVERFIGKVYFNGDYIQTTDSCDHDLEVDINGEVKKIEVKADHSPSTYNKNIRFCKTKWDGNPGFLYDLPKNDFFAYCRFSKDIYNKLETVYFFDSKKLFKIIDEIEKRDDKNYIRRYKGDLRQNENNFENYSKKEIIYVRVFEDNGELKKEFKDALISKRNINFVFDYMMTNEEIKYV